VKGCVFDNVNQADSASYSMLNFFSSDAGYSQDITIEDCYFSGYASSTRTNNDAININGNVKRLKIANCTFVDIPGMSVNIHPGTGYTVTGVKLIGLSLDGSNNEGMQAFMSSGTGVVSNIEIIGCTFKDCAKQTGSAGILLGGSSTSAYSFAAGIVSGCRAYKTAGATMLRGLTMVKGSGGTTDNITIVGCDFSGCVTSEMSLSGAPTNIHFAPKPGRGTDIASAATIAIPTDGTIFHVTGNTNITNGITVNAWDNGRTVTLIFDSTPTVSDTGTSKLAAAFVATADDALTLACDGTNWYQAAPGSAN